MNRGKKIIIVSNCLLNANAKIRPYAFYPGVNNQVIEPLLAKGAGIIQLPCPETGYLGMRRWGVTREQLDTLSYREHCAAILKAPLLEMLAYDDVGYELECVLGVNGSPSCGVDMTCAGYTGGEIPADGEELARHRKNLRMIPVQGIFMEVLSDLLKTHGLSVQLTGVNEDQ